MDDVRNLNRGATINRASLEVLNYDHDHSFDDNDAQKIELGEGEARHPRCRRHFVIVIEIDKVPSESIRRESGIDRGTLSYCPSNFTCRCVDTSTVIFPELHARR